MTHTQTPASPLNNRILLQMPAADREALLAGAEYCRFPVGYVSARAADVLSAPYFPDMGVVLLMSEMTTGHQVAVSAVGAEGVVRLDALWGDSELTHPLFVLVESAGYRVPAEHFTRMFEDSAALRCVTLNHIGRTISELVVAAGCYRLHSHRERLARWLLVATERTGQHSLRVTHDMLAQMVGGPRHAVTMALHELRNKGAVSHLRGRIDIVNQAILMAQACECQVRPLATK